MFRVKYVFSFAILYLLSAYTLLAQQKDTIFFNVLLQDPASHLAHVTMKCPVGNSAEAVNFKMPQWMPGFYQIMNYAKHVSHFEAKDKEGKVLSWNQTSSNTWKANTGGSVPIMISYDVLADSPFVTTSFMDTMHAYLTPAATFLYIDKQIQTPIKLSIQNYAG